MKSLAALLLLLPVFLVGQAPSAWAQATEYPEVDRFARGIQGIIWDLRGTNSLKRLRWDGENFAPVDEAGRSSGGYEKAFVDVGVVRLEFKGPNNGWYFFSDDQKLVTPLTVAGEVPFKLAEGAKPKPIRQFPADIQQAVWESEPDERNLQPAKLRWNGQELEIAVKNRAGNWDVHRPKGIVANRRVLEVIDADGSLLWFAFSADGTEAWMLQLENIFGGHARNHPGRAKVTPQESGLSPQLNDLANHAEDLAAAGDTMRANTLRRHLARKLADQPQLAKAVDQRLEKAQKSR